MKHSIPRFRLYLRRNHAFLMSGLFLATVLAVLDFASSAYAQTKLTRLLLLSSLPAIVSMLLLPVIVPGISSVRAQNLPPIISPPGCMNQTYKDYGSNNSSVGCTANEVGLAKPSYTLIDGCDDTSDTATISLMLEVDANTDRYDIGVWTSLDGDSALTGANCSVAALPYTGPSSLDLDGTDGSIGGTTKTSYCSDDGGASIYYETTAPFLPYTCSTDAQCDSFKSGMTCKDGSKWYEWPIPITGSPIQDTCGDINGATSPLTADVGQVTVSCSNVTDGLLTIPMGTSWAVDKTWLCLTPTATFPSSPSKCKKDIDIVLDVPVGKPQIIVNIVTVPADDPESFPFTLSGTTDSGTPFTTQSFPLSGLSDPYGSGVLLEGTYTVAEGALPAGWTLENATCINDKGSDDNTGDDETVSPTDIDLSNGEVVRCTFTYKSDALAVTIGYFLAERDGDTVSFVWQTGTETGMAGFNLLVESDGDLVQINDELIPSTVIDSVTPTDYSYEAVTTATAFYIEEVSIAGSTDRVGPFTLGIPAGAHVDTDPIPFTWIPMISN